MNLFFCYWVTTLGVVSKRMRSTEFSDSDSESDMDIMHDMDDTTIGYVEDSQEEVLEYYNNSFRHLGGDQRNLDNWFIRYLDLVDLADDWLQDEHAECYPVYNYVEFSCYTSINTYGDITFYLDTITDNNAKMLHSIVIKKGIVDDIHTAVYNLAMIGAILRLAGHRPVVQLNCFSVEYFRDRGLIFSRRREC